MDHTPNHDPIDPGMGPALPERTPTGTGAPPVVAPEAGGMAAGEPVGRPSRTLWGDALFRLRRNKMAVIALIWIVVIIIIALTADLWAKRLLGSPTEIDTTTFASRILQSPSRAHPFGTDDLGRDVMVRVIYGARISLAVGVVATSMSIFIGLVMGALAAFYQGFADSVIMRLADVFLAFPYILFAIALVAVLGPGMINLFIAIGILGWPTISRVIRSSMLSVQENEYVDAARALGASDARIVLRHILPNSMAPIIVYGTMSIGGAILAEAALSFLGLGVLPPNASWGLMLSDARNYLFTAPWLMLYPGFAILTTVLAFVLLGDGLRDALDVKMQE